LDGGINQKGVGPNKKKEKPDTPPPPHVAKKPQRYRINRITAGFSVTPGENGVAPPPRLEIRTAYDVRRGNPLAKYRSEDFQLNKSPILTDMKGINVLECAGNRMLVEITDKDFNLTVVGFDENRDLVIRAAVKGDGHDTTV
jgi:hypothetical protein